MKAGGGRATLNPSGAYSSKPDVAIVVFGEETYAEFQGDLDTLEFNPGDKAELTLLRKLRGDGIPVVSVFLSGRPMWVNPELNASDAFVAAWLPGSEGGGIADVLFAKTDGSINHDFRGKLPFAWPRTPVQTTADPGAQPPLFAYDFGLTYADDAQTAAPPRELTSRAANPVRAGVSRQAKATIDASRSRQRPALRRAARCASLPRTTQPRRTLE